MECSRYACDILLLGSYSRTWNWHTKGESKDTCSVTATMETDLKYKELDISIYPAFFESPERKRFGIIFHEFCHVITEHQYMVIVNLNCGKLVTSREMDFAREHETSLMEKSFLWLLDDPKRYEDILRFINSLSTEYKCKK